MTQYYLIPSDELYHHGVLGMRWGHRKGRVSKGHRKGRVSKGNRYRENNRRTSFIQTEKSLKKKIESDKREADNRVKFYGGKAAATAAIQNEASHRKAVKGAKGYQIRYSTSKKMKKAKVKTLNSKTRSTTLKLSRHKKYYVQTRSYSIINGKKVYSKWTWSSIKSFKTK